jgi:DUF1365 family protein
MTLPLPEPARRAEPPACLYDGHVMHVRSRPVAHRFRYRVFSLLIDLDRLDEADKLSPLFGVNRPNLVSFHERDHGRSDGTPLAAQSRALAHAAGVESEISSVALLCYPRVFGYAFNPLSVYYLFDRSGEVSCILYEVHNTFSQRHTYAARVSLGERDGLGLRQTRDKLLYVSPFIDMAMRYEFYLRAPAESLFFRIAERDEHGLMLIATFAAVRRRLTSRSLLARCLAIPALGLKVIGAIHFEAARLWLKGLRPFARPDPPEPASFGSEGAFSSRTSSRRESLGSQPSTTMRGTIIGSRAISSGSVEP